MELQLTAEVDGSVVADTSNPFVTSYSDIFLAGLLTLQPEGGVPNEVDVAHPIHTSWNLIEEGRSLVGSFDSDCDPACQSASLFPLIVPGVLTANYALFDFFLSTTLPDAPGTGLSTRPLEFFLALQALDPTPSPADAVLILQLVSLPALAGAASGLDPIEPPAFIQFTGTVSSVDVAVVPLPPALGLFAGALAALPALTIRYRRDG